jgi:DNA-binding transcriptional ArsR family regulator
MEKPSRSVSGDERLKSNHATVIRKLRDLTEDNIVDFRSEGKNKVYSVKRPLKAETLNTASKKQLEQRNSSLIVKLGNFDTRFLLIREIIRDHIIIKGVEVYFYMTGFFEKLLCRKHFRNAQWNL